MSSPSDEKAGGLDAHRTDSPNWTINVSDVRTIRVGNVSPSATEMDIRELFCLSGDIHYVEMRKESETTQLAFVTFKDTQGTDTAMLLSGSIVVDLPVSISPVENYQLPPDAPPLVVEPKSSGADSPVIKKAEDVVSSMLAKSFVIGKDALKKTKSFDEKHHLTSNASATMASLDRKMGLSQKLNIGTAVVNEKVREMDERFQVSEKTKAAIALAEQKATSTGSAILSNRYVLTGASWVTSAYSAVAKAAEDVSSMTKEKVEKAEEEKRENIVKDRATMINDHAQIHLDESSVGEATLVPTSDDHSP